MNTARLKIQFNTVNLRAHIRSDQWTCCAVPQSALHQHRVEPATMLPAYGAKHSRMFETQPLVQPN